MTQNPCRFLPSLDLVRDCESLSTLRTTRASVGLLHTSYSIPESLEIPSSKIEASSVSGKLLKLLSKPTREVFFFTGECICLKSHVKVPQRGGGLWIVTLK